METLYRKERRAGVRVLPRVRTYCRLRGVVRGAQGVSGVVVTWVVTPAVAEEILVTSDCNTMTSYTTAFDVHHVVRE